MESGAGIEKTSQGKTWLVATSLVVVACLMVVSARVLLQPFSHSVFPIYSFAADNWVRGESTYFSDHPSRKMDVYRYAPPITPLFVPFFWLGNSLGGVAWRLLNWGSYLAASAFFFWRFLDSKPGIQWHCIFILMALPLALSNLNNGQINLLMISCILGGFTLLFSGKIVLGSILFSVATAFKVFPVIIALLVGMAFPLRFFSGYFLGLLVIGLSPFLFQSPDYVLDQYSQWVRSIRMDDRTNWNLEDSYRDFWLLIRVLDLPINIEMYRLIQAGSAMAVGLAAFFKLKTNGANDQWGIRVFGLSCCWIALLGPSTESSTFVLVGPLVAMALLEIIQGEKCGERWLAIAGTVVLGAMLVSGAFPGAKKAHAMGFHPIGAIFLLAYFAFRLMNLRCDRKKMPVPGMCDNNRKPEAA